MGAGNVKAAFVHWGGLPGGPFRLLVYMALRTKDGDKHPQFWGGREDLAFGLGRRVPEERDEVSRKAREAAFKALKDAMAVLTRRGAVRVVERARPGRNAVYEINLDPPHDGERGTETVPCEPVDNPPVEPVDNPDMGHGNPPPNGARFSSGMGHGFPPQRGTVFVGMGHGNRPPKEEKDESGLNEGGDTQGFPASSPLCTTPAAANDPDTATASTSTTGPAAKTWTYRDACEYLMTRPGEQRDEAERLATAELGPAAKREDVLMRAAHHAHRIATGVPA